MASVVMFSLFLSQSFVSRYRDQKAAQDQAEGKERGQVKKFTKMKSNSEFLLLLLFCIFKGHWPAASEKGT